MKTFIKAFSLVGTLVVILPLGIVAALELPKYHPDHPYLWFFGAIFALWLWQWHRFIDHLASGKDAESFFAAL